MSEETAAYFEQLLVEVIEHGEQEGQEAFIDEAFADLVLDDLEQDGRWPDYQLCHHKSHGARVDAWGLDRGRQILFLAIVDFDRAPSTLSIPRSKLDQAVRRLTSFLGKARRGVIEAEVHNPVADLLEVVARAAYESVVLYVLTNRVAPAADLPDHEADGLPVTAKVWDLETTRRFRETGTRLDPINVDLSQRFGAGLPFLDGGEREGVRTLLLFLPAEHLAAVYQQYGGRLLERNVRAFLSARGKVNRGLRETLDGEPERFLAYNNGLTATAADIQVTATDGLPTVTAINDLQIVNGGQTTASIANAARDPEIDLSSVIVQMKLVVVKGELLDELVPNISRYANSQNAVQESDLSANNDFLRHLQAVSRTEWTPATSGRPTRWYFERARGSFSQDHVGAGTAASQKRFLLENPKTQRFGKNELALYENTWARLPHLVCRGSQKNFTEFMLRHPKPPDGLDEDAFKSWYRTQFRETVARGIVFKAADSAVRRAHGGAYKRAVVAYTLSWILEHAPAMPDLALIWRAQQAPEELVAAVVAVGGDLKKLLIDSARGQNITEWAKKDACREILRRESFDADLESIAGGATVLEYNSGNGAHRLWNRPGRRLAEVIEEVHGEPIEGRFKRYRRRKWRHLGDSGVSASGGGTLHVYAAPMTDGDGRDYVFTVTVDFAARGITPLSQLDERRSDLVSAWLVPLGVVS